MDVSVVNVQELDTTVHRFPKNVFKGKNTINITMNVIINITITINIDMTISMTIAEFMRNTTCYKNDQFSKQVPKCFSSHYSVLLYIMFYHLFAKITVEIECTYIIVSKLNHFFVSSAANIRLPRWICIYMEWCWIIGQKMGQNPPLSLCLYEHVRAQFTVKYFINSCVNDNDS